MSAEHDDPTCAVAHGATPAEVGDRTLVAVFASPVAAFLTHFAADAGFRCVLLEPDPGRATGDSVTMLPPGLDGDTDVVVTDHHRDELGTVLRDVLELPVRWVGVMGNPRHEGPHVKALAALGVPDEEIARVRRPIGLNIGSRTPPEIAIATLAGLIADRNGRPGGFTF
jgi:xanthine/CO dehydrogenase XdhC/CoxF family maturation factor